jgi:hypothetical protein
MRTAVLLLDSGRSIVASSSGFVGQTTQNTEMLADASKRPILAGGKAVSDESKSDESKIGAVLANAPAIKKAFGPLGR